jgi:hypothetical protein
MSIEKLKSRVLGPYNNPRTTLRPEHPEYSGLMRVNLTTTYSAFKEVLEQEDVIYAMEGAQFEHFLPFLLAYASETLNTEADGIVYHLIPDPRTNGELGVEAITSMKERVDQETREAVLELFALCYKIGFADDREKIQYAIDTVWGKP